MEEGTMTGGELSGKLITRNPDGTIVENSEPKDDFMNKE
jgi:hypothetical protein